MTDEELGRKLAEACGFAIEKLRVFLNDVPVYFAPEAENSHPVLFLATSLDAIVRDVFPVLDERFGAGKWAYSLDNVTGAKSGQHRAVVRPVALWRSTMIAQGGPTLARAMAEACLAALTEVTA